MPIVSSLVAAPLLLGGAWVLGGPLPAPETPVSGTTPARCVPIAAVERAASYASDRPGHVSFAVYERGELRSSGGGVPYRSASLVKAMLLVADLRRHARLHEPLSPSARSRLSAMIRTSDNDQATATFNLVGEGAVRAVAEAAGMRHYRVAGHWGNSQLAAADQARFFGRLDELLPPKYRDYAHQLLRSIVPYQTWGGAPVSRKHGFRTMFKSGWLPQPGGWVVHQGLRLERGSCRVGVAVLTGAQPSLEAGAESIRGVVERLL